MEEIQNSELDTKEQFQQLFYEYIALVAIELINGTDQERNRLKKEYFKKIKKLFEKDTCTPSPIGENLFSCVDNELNIGIENAIESAESSLYSPAEIYDMWIAKPAKEKEEIIKSYKENL